MSRPPPAASTASPTDADSGATGESGASRWRPSPRWLVYALAVAVLAGAVARLHTDSALWLDESLSVGIARRPLPDLFDALRRDGSPPLYYLLLHSWMAVFGESDTATRSLSMIFSLATLPVVWLCGRRVGGSSVAWGSVVILSATPFAVRYATETRMYALVQLLTALGVLGMLRALERPTPVRLLPVTLVSGALALTHYWTLFLLASTAIGLLLAARLSRRHRRSALLSFGALAAGLVIFLPWLPSFLFQTRHTGTPWAPPPGAEDVWRTVTVWAGTSGWQTTLLTLLMLGLTTLALAGHRPPAPLYGVIVGRPVHRTAALLFATAFGTLLLGLGTGIVAGAGYSPRYSSTALVPAVLVTALGLRALSYKGQLVALSLVAWLGLTTAIPMIFADDRTQAQVTATRLTAALQPGDVVVYCPDQLGPAVSRLLPAGTDQVTYPLLTSPEIIDWVDYAQRNAAADPEIIANQVSQRTRGGVFVVWAEGYRTFGDQCEQLNETLSELRGDGLTMVQRDPHFGEQERVVRFPGLP